MRVPPPFAALLFLGGVVATMAGCADRADGPAPTQAPVPSSSAAPGAPSFQPVPGPVGQAWFRHASGAPADRSSYGGEPPAFRLSTVAGAWGWEPSIGVSDEGAVFYAFPVETPFGQEVHVLRSTDWGATWTDLDPALVQDLPPNSLASDPYLTVDRPTGRVFALHLRAECNTLSWSDDAGKTWLGNPAACGNPFEDRPILFTGPPTVAPALDPSFPRVLYLCSNQVFVTTCKASLDGGVSFRQTAPPFASDPDCLPAGTGTHATNGASSEPTGSAFVARPACGAVRVARTTDGGLSWTQSAVDAPYHGEACGRDTVLAVGTDGTVYSASLDEACRPVLSWSLDDGLTWAQGVVLGPPGLAEASHLGIAAGAAGKVAVSYLGTSDGATSGSARAWSLYVALTQDAFAADPVFATVDAGGRPLVAGPSPGGAGFNAGLSGVGDFLDLAVHGPTGRLAAAAVDVCQGPCEDPGGPAPLGIAAIVLQVAGDGLA